MININDFRNFLLFVANKEGHSGYLPPDDFNSITERALMEWVMKRFGNPHEYQPGRPVSLFSYEKTQKLMDDMRRYKEDRNFHVDDGKVKIPDGETVKDVQSKVAPTYLHLGALRAYQYIVEDGTTREYEADVEIVKDSEFGRRMGSMLKPPTAMYPIANFQKDYIRIEPSITNMVKMVYLRRPDKPKWAYTTNNGRPVYDEANSVDIDAPYEAFNEIVVMALSYIGVHIRENQLTQYSETKQQTGI